MDYLWLLRRWTSFGRHFGSVNKDGTATCGLKEQLGVRGQGRGGQPLGEGQEGAQLAGEDSRQPRYPWWWHDWFVETVSDVEQQ